MRLLVARCFMFVLLAGCASPKEVAVIIERPAAPVEMAPIAVEEPTPQPRSTATVGRFDGGKMWTFDNPPLDYFEEAYGMRPDTTWFMRARLGALRFSSSCSASFVSPHGLILTNHHCARESIVDVSREEEDLLEEGFYASELADERKVHDLYVEQLISINDVTSSIHSASRAVRGDNEKMQVRRNKARQVEEQMMSMAKARDSTLHVQVIELYNGGRYAAYTYRRYEDVRLVMAPENRLGYFGGDSDNFTYPRYSLDMSFFRAYDADGNPVTGNDFFSWDTSGSQEGDVVFVVGNPGSTNRSSTVAILEYARDYALPQQIAALEERVAALEAYLGATPEGEEPATVRNSLFSMRNSIKASTGELAGLRDSGLMARRLAAEENLRRDLAQVDSLEMEFGGVFQSLEELQRSRKAETSRAAAFLLFGSTAGSRVLTRALYGYYYDTLQRRGVFSPAELEEVRKDALAFEDNPPALEQALVAIRLRDLERALGPTDPTFRKVTGGLPIDSVASQLVATTAIADSAGYTLLLDGGYLSSEDPTVEFINAIAPLYFTVTGQEQSFSNREELLKGHLSQVRFALYGTQTPPDASFSLRIADGVVQGYAYNGTKAPPYTTFYGLYNHYYAYRGVSESWDLPEAWLMPPSSFDMATPLNLVSTNDIAGGNSGSPLLNRDLEIVGLIFDGNMESLPNTYLYSDVAGRAISVDARAILEALDDIYDTDRLVLELTRGRLAKTDEEAEAVGQ